MVTLHREKVPPRTAFRHRAPIVVWNVAKNCCVSFLDRDVTSNWRLVRCLQWAVASALPSKRDIASADDTYLKRRNEPPFLPVVCVMGQTPISHGQPSPEYACGSFDSLSTRKKNKNGCNTSGSFEKTGVGDTFCTTCWQRTPTGA